MYTTPTATITPGKDVTATPSTPKEEQFRIQGVRTPGGGYGKGRLRPLTASEKEGAAESRSPPPMKVKRHLMPPPIVRAPSQFQEDRVKSPEPSIHKLAAQVKKLCKKNIELRDRNAELGVELAEIRNNFDTLSRATDTAVLAYLADRGNGRDLRLVAELRIERADSVVAFSAPCAAAGGCKKQRSSSRPR
ncbi:hypothetical protein OsI_15217 [Oryza sativa Indica Group]|uniref:Uncharacterized protein n=1 Tax=Oryza sativa subsp. indica TaxID=39946 RepID=B8ARX3_ORYSI|nr:hypothetical protein OsI_15217 [Oryza sativa Indica Group]